MKTVTIKIKESAYDKIMYFLTHLKDDIDIIEPQADVNGFEIIKENDPDYQYIKDAKQRRESGEKTYSLDEILKEYE